MGSHGGFWVFTASPGADGRGASQEGGRLGRRVVGDGEMGSDLGDGGGQRKLRRLGDSRAMGEGGLDGPPTISGQQTHPTRGFSSSKTPHTHVHTRVQHAHKPMYSVQTHAPSQAWSLKGQSFLSLPLRPPGSLILTPPPRARSGSGVIEPASDVPLCPLAPAQS